MIIPYSEQRYFCMWSTDQTDGSEREDILGSIGCDVSRVAYVDQVHGADVLYVTEPGLQWSGDAMYTDTADIVLEIRTADCVPILFYAQSLEGDHIAWAIHSGRWGTQKNIVWNTFDAIKRHIPLDMDTCMVWIWPSTCEQCFEFGDEVHDLFDPRYITSRWSQHYLDVSWCVYDQLIDTGISPTHIQKSPLCTMESDTCYSYRKNQTEERMHHWIKIV